MKTKDIFLYIYNLTPSFLKLYIKNKRDAKKKERIKKRMETVFVSMEELQSIFAKFELNSDVFLHSSITNIGNIEGGIPFICDLILNKVNTDEYALLVPALPIRGKFLDHLRTKPIFDVRTAPIKMGAISEYYAKNPFAQRSIHPTHSVLAIGKNSSYYIDSHHKDITPFNKNSPFYKLLQQKGKILYFGVNLEVTTFVHAIEDLFGEYFPVKVYDNEKFYVPVIDWDGNSSTVQTQCHDTKVSIPRDVLRLEKYFLAEKAITFSYPIGDSQIRLVDIHKFTIAYLHAMQKGETIYGHFKLTENINYRIDELLQQL